MSKCGSKYMTLASHGHAIERTIDFTVNLIKNCVNSSAVYVTYTMPLVLKNEGCINGRLPFDHFYKHII